MSWGTELWDQFDNLAIHTSKGIDLLDRYGSFVRDRSVIEVEYASKLRRLVKNYQPKKKDEEDYEFTSWQAFRNVLNEISDLASQHEVIAESLQIQVVNAISLLTKNLRDERKKALTEGGNLQQILAAQFNSLDRAKRIYEKSYRDSEKAVENFHRADADLNLSRAEVEKQRHNMTIKNQQSDDAKNEYANQLQKANKLQQVHYEASLPEVFNKLQEIDEKRTCGLKEFVKGSADCESAVAPIIAKCLEGMCKASEAVNEKEDSAKVIEKYQSGFAPPADIPFEDLSRADSDSFNHSQTQHGGNNALNHLTLKGTISAHKLKKRAGIFGIFSSNKSILSSDALKEDFSDLPPNQRRKKLNSKLQELQQKVQQETAARDGLMKMKVVYEANSLLGDPMTVEGQLNESEHKLEKLKIEMKKYQGYLEQANAVQLAQHSPQTNRNVQNRNRVSRHSNDSGENDDGEDHPDDGPSLSRSASENSVAQAQNEKNNNESGTSASPMSHTSLPESNKDSAVEGTSSEEVYYEVEPLQPIGSCRALYPFDATSEGSIPMAEGEELQVIEHDQGDGWTRVRRLTGSNGWEEGFVPTSYIECSLYT